MSRVVLVVLNDQLVGGVELLIIFLILNHACRDMDAPRISCTKTHVISVPSCPQLVRESLNPIVIVERVDVSTASDVGKTDPL